MRKFLLISIIIISYCIAGSSQTFQIDSLFNSLKSQKVDSCIYSTYIKIAEYYKDSAFDKSLIYYNKALEIVENTNQRKRVADVYHSIGYMYLNKGELPSALSNLHNALNILEFIKDREGVGQILNDIGLIYKTWGKYEKAIENFHKALQVFDESGNEKFIAVVSNNIGQIYYYRNEYEKSIPYFSKYLDVNKKSHNPRAVAGAANNIASAYLELGKLDDALDFYVKAMRIYDSLGIKVGVAIIKDNIGSLYIRKKQYNDALVYNVEASKIFEELGSQSRLCASLQCVGLAYSKLNQPHLALKSLNQSLEIATKLNQQETKKDVYETLAEVYAQLNEYEKALNSYKLYSQVKDSLLNSETIGKIETIQAEYESQKKEKELAEVNQKFKSQKILGVIAAGVIILFLFLTSLIIRENQNKKQIITKSNEKLNSLYKAIGMINSKHLIKQKNIFESIALFKNQWVINSNVDNEQFFVSYYREPNLFFAFISKGVLTENEEIVKLSIIDFLTSSYIESDELSIKEQFANYISNNDVWNPFKIDTQIINIDFWCINRNTFQHFYSGNISAYHINDRNIISDLSKSEIQSLKKGERLYFCTTSSLNSFILNDQNVIQNNVFKTIEKSISIDFEQQKEILENSFELIEAGNGQSARISIFAIQV